MGTDVNYLRLRFHVYRAETAKDATLQCDDACAKAEGMNL